MEEQSARSGQGCREPRLASEPVLAAAGPPGACRVPLGGVRKERGEEEAGAGGKPTWAKACGSRGWDALQALGYWHRGRGVDWVAVLRSGQGSLMAFVLRKA
ncbi:hypothetical protein HYQ46_006745 [Verticillium longisporum]|nr:hypothetical protein HYQ46_006745 [Verticillium longisporum]